MPRVWLYPQLLLLAGLSHKGDGIFPAVHRIPVIRIQRAVVYKTAAGEPQKSGMHGFQQLRRSLRSPFLLPL